MTAKELRTEILRRSVSAGNVLTAPRPKQWQVGKATDWLEKNPIVAEDEVAFIRRTISHRIAVAERAALGSNVTLPAVSNVGGGGGANWVGMYPLLRIIHAIIDVVDNKAAYVHRLRLPSGRMAIENRKTEGAIQANVWHKVAQTWNDPLFHPRTSVKDSHSDFAQPIAIPFEAVSSMSPATPEKVEEKWNSMNLALKRKIQNWERSGQGFGGYEEEVDDDDEDEQNSDFVDGDEKESFEFGVLAGRPQRALDLRRNFFDDRNTVLLYLWDILDEHELISSTMQQLVEGVGAGDGSAGVPSVIVGRKRGNDDDSFGSSSKKRNNDTDAFAQLSFSIEKHSKSLVDAARIAASEQAKNRCESRVHGIRERINTLRDTRRNLVIRMAAPDVISNQAVVNAITHEVEGIDEEIESNEKELNELQATPTKSNRSPI
jgi:hypothetical protein